MKFIFAAPRLHPNFHYQLEALVEGEHEVEFFALHSARGEVHGSVVPRVFGYAPSFRLIRSLMPKEAGKRTRGRFELVYSFPPVFRFARAVWTSRADAIVVKNIMSAYSFLALCIGIIFGKRLIVFMSIDKHRPKQRSWSVFLVGLLGAKVMTPLLGDIRFPNDNPNLVYVPLPHPVMPRNAPYAPENTVRIICVGKFSVRKDQMRLLEAANELKDRYAFTLTFIGLTDEDTYLNRMRSYLSEHGLEDRVSFHFDMPWDQVYAEYARHDLFVLPSYKELHSFAALEAMASGLPAIVTTDNGIKWYVKDGETGFIVPPRDRAALVRALEEVLKDHELLARMGKQAQDQVRTACSLEGYRDTMVQLVAP